jgi:hypothetical protein
MDSVSPDYIKLTSPKAIALDHMCDAESRKYGVHMLGIYESVLVGKGCVCLNWTMKIIHMSRRLSLVMAGLLVAGPICLLAFPEIEAQGEYRGYMEVDGARTAVFARVMALGDGNFRATFLTTLDERVEPIGVMDGQVQGDAVEFQNSDEWSAMLDVTAQTLRGNPSIELKRFVRTSPTLGAPPPESAVVLLGAETKDLREKWTRWQDQAPTWRILSAGVMEARRNHHLMSRQEFGDAQIHLEYWQPLRAGQREQRRGNSGIYVQGLYEVQILDSFGIEGSYQDAGAIYEIATPKVNMALPPGQWQTLDITFTAARMDGDEVQIPAKMTVKHNGVLVLEDVDVPRTTRGAPYNQIRETGGVYLQGRCPVRFRNIWVLPR